MAAAAVPVAIALGSNLGDRAVHLDAAIVAIRAFVAEVRVSPVYEFAAEDVPDPQPPFLNAALVGVTTLEARPLLDRLLAVERRHGRQRPFHHAARTLDLDLILYGDRVIAAPGLKVPHPRFRERRFVLAPLADIAGAWVDPVTGAPISALLRSLPPGAS